MLRYQNIGQRSLEGIATNNKEANNMKSTTNETTSQNETQEVTKIFKVLYMRRNPIDVMISQVKHNLSGGVSGHCGPNDEKCIAAHSKREKHLRLGTTNLVNKLEYFKEEDEAITTKLHKHGIDYYQTFYDKLYEADDASEWMNIFRYLGVGPMEGLTLEKVAKAFPLAKTTKLPRKQILANYEEVYDVLKDTEFLHFLTD